jgi:hypothetical protein
MPHLCISRRLGDAGPFWGSNRVSKIVPQQFLYNAASNSLCRRLIHTNLADLSSLKTGTKLRADS